jgi:uncharacterized protein YraI
MEGEQVQMVGRNRTGTWVQIQLYNGYRGWVHAGYIRPTIDIAALPIADVALLGITAFVTNDPIPVYTGPDTRYPFVGRAQPGDTLALNGRNDAATWVHVYLPDGRAGWVAADSPFLPSASLNDLPILAPFLDAPPPDLSPFFLVYNGPGFLYEPIDRVIEGQSLGIIGRTADNRWVLIRTAAGGEGWIAAEIIHIGAAIEHVPVVTGIAPPQVVGWQSTAPTVAPGTTPAGGGKPTAQPPPTITASPTPEPTATATQVALPTATATATPRPATATPQATATERATAVPTSSGATGDEATPPGIPIVYVYATPDANTVPILRVIPGQSVVLIGRTEDTEWIKIWLPGEQEGWVQSAVLHLEIDPSVLPIVAP